MRSNSPAIIYPSSVVPRGTYTDVNGNILKIYTQLKRGNEPAPYTKS